MADREVKMVSRLRSHRLKVRSSGRHSKPRKELMFVSPIAAAWDLGHCDPDRCSGKKLMRQGLMRDIPIGKKFSGVVITY